MLSAGAPLATTTSGGLITALRALDLRRIAVVTPYIDSVTERLLTFLDEHRIEVVSSVGLGLLDHIWKVGYAEIVQAVTAVDVPEADGLFISCTNVPTYDIIGPLERWLGKPVLTANQVTMWSALSAIGSPMMAAGQWLAETTQTHAA
jgi:maleate isomerase